MIKELAYAKININLKVIGKRADGYHNLESIMVAVDLCDELTFEHDDNISLISNIDIKDNFIIQSANLLKKIYNINLGAKITLKKMIPLGAGLAGGSADSSATLRGLNKLWNLKLSLDDLAKISLQIGSDNAFCMYNKMAFVSGRGEMVKFIDQDLPEFALLVNPGFSISTKEIFSHFEKSLITDTNDLERIALNLYPEFQIFKKEVEAFGLNFQMSGSGPTLFTLSNDEKSLQEVARQLEDKYKVFCTKIIKK